ncbi:hypothetical protein niasHT_025664 [Heterodera trifolii]|uniref:Lon proteolytic domain-containing protein n=1 Tax=Heterodera trifolii TaxID=157864 RepID=A0ABD2KFD7_9BILA
MIGVVVGLSRSDTVTEETKGGGLMNADNDRRRRRARQSFNRLGDNRIHSFQKVDAQNGRHLPGESPGGYGKSGPSGALTEAIAFISIARGDKPRAKCAITGQLTIKGFVLKVSSIAEKTQAAMKGKFTTMVMPAGNKSDFESLPEGGRIGITPKFVIILTFCDATFAALTFAALTLAAQTFAAPSQSDTCGADICGTTLAAPTNAAPSQKDFCGADKCGAQSK